MRVTLEARYTREATIQVSDNLTPEELVKAVSDAIDAIDWEGLPLVWCETRAVADGDEIDHTA